MSPGIAMTRPSKACLTILGKTPSRASRDAAVEDRGKSRIRDRVSLPGVGSRVLKLRQ